MSSLRIFLYNFHWTRVELDEFIGAIALFASCNPGCVFAWLYTGRQLRMHRSRSLVARLLPIIPDAAPKRLWLVYLGPLVCPDGEIDTNIKIIWEFFEF